jgi:hypothetical protein
MVKGKKMKKRRKVSNLANTSFTKKLIANALNVSLFFAQTQLVFANDIKDEFSAQHKLNNKSIDSSVLKTNDILNMAEGVGVLAKKLMSSKSQNMQLEQSRARARETQLAITPKQGPDDFFPQCKILNGKTNKITGLCEEISSDADYIEAYQIFNTSIQNETLFDNHIIHGNKMGDTKGLQCIAENANKLRTQLQQRVNDIEEMQRMLDHKNAEFEKLAKDHENKMQEVNGLLTGGDGFEFDKTNRDLAGLFKDPSCKATINFDSTANKSSAEGGLLGMRNAIQASGVDEAQTLLDTAKSKERQFRRDVNDYAKSIASAAKTGKDLSEVVFISPYALDKTIAKAKEQATVKYDEQKAEIQLEISKLGLEASETVDIGDAKTDINTNLARWKRNADNSCFDNKVTKNLAKFEKNTYQRNSRISKSATNKRNFFQRIGEILKNNRHWSLKRKIKEIKAIESSLGYTSLAINMGTALKNQKKDRAWNVSEAISTYSDDCSREFDSLEYKNTSFTGKQLRKKIKSLHKKMISTNKSHAQTVANELLARFIGCKGIEYPAQPTPTDCNANKLKTSNADGNFCLKQSVACAQSINTCYNKAQTIVKAKQFEQRSMAKTYNKKVRQFKLSQYKLFTSMEAKFKGSAELLAQYFPGASYKIPFDITVNPEKDGYSKKHGVQLLKSSDFTADMKTNLEKLKALIVEQNTKIIGDTDNVKLGVTASGQTNSRTTSTGDFGGIIGEKMETLNANYTSERTYWGTLANLCKENMMAYKVAKAQGIDKQNESIAERNSKVQRFCSTIETINHTPGCGRVSELADTAFEIADEIGLSAIDAAKMGNIGSYQAICESSQGHDSSNSMRSPSSILTAGDVCEKDEYKKTKECKSWKDFGKYCEDDDGYYKGLTAYNELKTELGHDSASEMLAYCKLKVEEEEAPDNPENDELVKKKNICKRVNANVDKDFQVYKICGDDESQKTDKEIELLEPIEEIAKVLGDQKEIESIRADVGEQSFEVCNAQDSSARGVLKGLVEDIGSLNVEPIDTNIIDG